ncbi:hypothetical protein BCI9360_03349 [Bacillus sp. CECT 9360]|nr:hypothetical protein BCI9360_03349 [Bacillus sp. CECT 9360]
MEFTLLDNGIDSLKKRHKFHLKDSKNCIDKIHITFSKMQLYILIMGLKYY